MNKPALPADAKNLTLTIKNVRISFFVFFFIFFNLKNFLYQVTVPAEVSTTYWCAGYKLPDEFSQKRYIVQVLCVGTTRKNGKCIHTTEHWHISGVVHDQMRLSGHAQLS